MSFESLPRLYYTDYERMGRDTELSGDIYTIETACEEARVFWSR